MHFDDIEFATRIDKRNAAGKNEKKNRSARNALRELKRLNPIDMAYSNGADEFDYLLD